MDGQIDPIPIHTSTLLTFKSNLGSCFMVNHPFRIKTRDCRTFDGFCFSQPFSTLIRISVVARYHTGRSGVTCWQRQEAERIYIVFTRAFEPPASKHPLKQQRSTIRSFTSCALPCESWRTISILQKSFRVPGILEHSKMISPSQAFFVFGLEDEGW